MGGERGERGPRVALGQPERCGRDAEFPAVAVLLAEPGQDLLGPLDLVQADQGTHQQRSGPGDEVVRPGESAGQRVAGLEGGQRRGVTVSNQFQRPADDADRQYHQRPGIGGEGALGELDPRLCRIRLSLPHQHDADDHAGDAGCRVVGPAVLFGQCRRLPAALGRPRERVVELVQRLVGQPGELQVRPSALAGQRDAPVQVTLGVLGCGHKKAHPPRPPPQARHPPRAYRREPGQQLMHGRGLPVQVQGRPAPSPAPPGYAGPPPPRTRARRASRRRRAAR